MQRLIDAVGYVAPYRGRQQEILLTPWLSCWRGRALMCFPALVPQPMAHTLQINVERLVHGARYEVEQLGGNDVIATGTVSGRPTLRDDCRDTL
jgi:hypothetical protein